MNCGHYDPVIVAYDLGDRWQWQVVVGGEVVALGYGSSYEDAVKIARLAPL